VAGEFLGKGAALNANRLTTSGKHSSSEQQQPIMASTLPVCSTPRSVNARP